MKQMRNTSSSTTLDDSTIVAIATPIGIGAISIVRLSGARAYEITLLLTKKNQLLPRYAHLCRIYDREGVAIDEAIVLYFPKPHSYTTQDVCEVQCHGGIVSARAIVELCIKLGARMAQAGEFSKRAFLGGRLDLAQIQAIAGLIQSQSLEANKMLMRQLSGELSTFVEEVRESLLLVLAYMEASIDYGDEVGDTTHFIHTTLGKIKQKLEQVYSASIARQGVINGYTLSIIGKPNVGKSSLLNALLMYERAIVSDIEGTTRDTIEETLCIGSALVRVVDTAGIRQSDDSIERIGITKAKEAVSRSDIILAVFDNSQHFDEKDSAIMDILEQNARENKHIVIILNKSDMGATHNESIFAKFNAPILNTSIKHNGARDILKVIEPIVSANSGSDSIILTSSYQLECLKNALDSINKVIAGLKDDCIQSWIELQAFHIQDCIESISALTRPYEHTELLDRLFGTFCLGK